MVLVELTVIYVITHKIKKGGAEVAAINLAKTFAAHGSSVRLVCIKNEDRVRELEGISIISPRWSSVRAFYILSSLKFLIKILRSLKSQNAVAISFQTDLNIATIFLGLFLGGADNVIVSERSDPFMYPHSKFLRVMRSLLYPKSALVITQTNYAKGYFGSKVKTMVCPNICMIGSGQNRFKERKSTKEEILLLAVGRLVETKRFDRAIDVVKIARQKNVAASLTIVGDGPCMGRLKARCRDLEIEEFVFFAGYQTNVSKYYESSHLLLCPSELEGLSNVIIEAQSFGLPSVVDPCCVPNTEIVNHNETGFILEDFSCVKNWENIFAFITNQPNLNEMAKRCCSHAEKYSVDRAGKTWLDAIGGIASWS